MILNGNICRRCVWEVTTRLRGMPLKTVDELREMVRHDGCQSCSILYQWIVDAHFQFWADVHGEKIRGVQTDCPYIVEHVVSQEC